MIISSGQVEKEMNVYEGMKSNKVAVGCMNDFVRGNKYLINDAKVRIYRNAIRLVLT